MEETAPPKPSQPDFAEIARTIQAFIRDFVDKRNKNGALVGLSGGIDSAVVAKLAIGALGKDKVQALILPERMSDPKLIERARALALDLKIPFKIISITPYLRSLGVYKLLPYSYFIPRNMLKKLVKKKEQEMMMDLGTSPFVASFKGVRDEKFNRGLAFMRAKVRMRMIVLSLRAEAMNYLLLGCLNRTEYLTGLFIPSGDGAADCMPLRHLLKTQVRWLARHLGLPENLISDPPSPDLIPGLDDESILGIPYEKLDRILAGMEAGVSLDSLAETLGEDVARILYVLDLKNLSQFLREPPPGLDS
jgi:NAD+ synthase